MYVTLFRLSNSNSEKLSLNTDMNRKKKKLKSSYACSTHKITCFCLLICVNTQRHCCFSVLLLCHLTKPVSFTIDNAVLLYFQALVYEHPGQELEIELFDEDPDKDDFLGR